MTRLLVVTFHRARECQGFDTYYLDSNGHYSGAFLNRRGWAFR